MVNSSCHEVLQHGTLAQLVEQRTFNPLVAGSNPARPTTPPGTYHTRFTFRNDFLTVELAHCRWFSVHEPSCWANSIFSDNSSQRSSSVAICSSIALQRRPHSA